jgi:hypothetical protein
MNMSSIANISGVLTELLSKSRSRQVAWEKGIDIVTTNGFPIGNEFIANFPDFSISVAKALPIEGVETVSFSIYGLDGQLLHSARLFKNEENFELLSNLYTSAQEYAIGLNTLFDNLRIAVDSLGTKGEVDKISSNNPSDVPASKFLKLFAGNWTLTYKKKGKIFKEEVIISEYGNYTIVRDEKKTHAFTLKNILFDIFSCHVSFDKVDTGEEKIFPPGRLRQREILDFTDKWNVLEGYAQYDKHYLKYERK